MAITIPLAEFFLQEHVIRPIGGRMLTLGRQTISITEAQLRQLLSAYKLPQPDGSLKLDTLTVQSAHGEGYISDGAFFRAFCGQAPQVLDVTDYEGATVLHDMCQPVPAALAGKFDFIFNGSILDNVFDPAMALRNMSRMLTPGGRVMHIEMASRLAFEYLIHGADWFLDYYVFNGFADCKVYVVLFDDVDALMHGPWEVFAYFPKPDGEVFNLKDLIKAHAAIVVVAEKGTGSTTDASPVQYHYRGSEHHAQWQQKYQAMTQGAKRPFYGFGQPNWQPTGSEAGFASCGKAGQLGKQ